MPTHVAVAVVKNHQGQVLISKRLPGRHMAGKWEFPGGKVEAEESVLHALGRELSEELDINVHQARPFIKIAYEYPDQSVLLDVFTIEDYSGEPKGNEGQEMAWVYPSDLTPNSFPPANVPIINAIKLPDFYFITPDLPAGSDAVYQRHIKQAVSKGINLIQLRCPQYSDWQYIKLAAQLNEFCVSRGVQLLMNSGPDTLLQIEAAGVHLNAKRLFEYSQRPVADDRWLSASCHSKEEVLQAVKLKVDFISISPVQHTRSHPDRQALGWGEFKSLTSLAGVPVYALGGMSCEDLAHVQACGGRGVAGIRAFI